MNNTMSTTTESASKNEFSFDLVSALIGAGTVALIFCILALCRCCFVKFVERRKAYKTANKNIYFVDQRNRVRTISIEQAAKCQETVIQNLEKQKAQLQAQMMVPNTVNTNADFLNMNNMNNVNNMNMNMNMNANMVPHSFPGTGATDALLGGQTTNKNMSVGMLQREAEFAAQGHYFDDSGEDAPAPPKPPSALPAPVSQTSFSLEQQAQHGHPPQPPKPLVPQKDPMLSDPEYARWFKILKIGAPEASVRNKMFDEGYEQAVVDRVIALHKDPTLPSASAAVQPPMPPAVPAVPQKDPMLTDPEYTRWFKILKIGAPATSVKNKMFAEGYDEATVNRVIALHNNPKLPPQGSGAQPQAGPPAPPAVPQKDPMLTDPEYARWFKILKIGAPAVSVKNKMFAEGYDEATVSRVIALHNNPNLPPQGSGHPQAGPPAPPQVPKQDPMLSDPEFARWFKILKIGAPAVSVKNKMLGEGYDEATANRLIDLHNKR